MAVDRVSTSLVRFLGAEVAARNIGGGMANVVKNGLGGERTRDAGSERTGESAGASNVESASIKIVDYEAALVHMQQNGVEPLAAKAMAVVMVDAANAQGVGVMSLLNNTSAEEISLVSASAYKYINQLRDGSSQLSGSSAIDNSRSLRARYLLA